MPLSLSHLGFGYLTDVERPDFGYLTDVERPDLGYLTDVVRPDLGGDGESWHRSKPLQRCKLKITGLCKLCT